MTGEGYENDDYLYELEEGTLDYLEMDDSDVSDLSLKLMEAVANLLDSSN